MSETGGDISQQTGDEAPQATAPAKPGASEGGFIEPGIGDEIDPRERERLSDLLDLGLINTRPEARFDRITRLATELLGMPVALMSLMEHERQWFKSTCGVEMEDAPRSTSVCDYTIRRDEALFVEDLREDPRFSSFPYVQDVPHVRSYAGMPVHGPKGKPVGTICLMGFEPRHFGERERTLLAEVVDWIEHEFDLDRLIQAREKRVAKLMDRDPSLPVATRTIAIERLGDVLAEGARAGRRCAVMHLEIANLGHFERTYSARLVRDTVAAWLGALQSESGRFLYINRLSDTEFVGAVAHDGPAEVTRRRCEQQLEQAASAMQAGETRVVFQVVGGLSLYGEHGTSAAELVSKARQAHTSTWLARGVVLFSEMVRKRLLRDRHIRRYFEKALGNGSIFFHWQPLFYNAADTLSGFELLARWEDPSLGAIYPDEFIPVAESEQTLSRALVRLALETAAAQIAAWDAELSGRRVPYIAVNIPGGEFYEVDFPTVVAGILDAHGITGDRLVMELTERSLIADFEIAAGTMDRLRTLGVRIAMDDFGTGYSSIAYLTRLPLSIVKLDKSVVQRLEHDAIARELLRGIVELAHGQQLQVVAEGVETRAQHEWTRSFGCEYTQGFLLARPESGDAARARVRARDAD